MFERFRKYKQEHGEFLKVVSCLNAAYLVSSLGDRLWSFSIGIIMHRLGGMTWVAIHQLAEELCKLVLATPVGDILDKVNRSKGIQSVLAANNICITISAMCFYLMFSGIGVAGSQGSKYLLFTAILFGASSRVASEAQKTAFTKDWIVVLIEKSNGGSRLSTQNGVMNMIDQGAAFLTPFIAGRLLDTYSGAFCCITIIVWNIASWTLEAAVLLWIYSKTPELSQTREQVEGERSSSPFKKYFRQKAFRAMFGLALLYMTVLGFDNLAISYGASQGMSASQLGFFRSLGSFLGFAGNGVYAFIERFIGVLLTGLIGLTLQNVFINFCSVSVFLPGNPFNATGYFTNLDGKTWISTVQAPFFVSNSTATEQSEVLLPFNELPISLIVFFVGITAARFGLWLADPAITQIMQETIPESERYSVNAAQNAFCAAFSILKDILVILISSTEAFGVLIIISCIFVFSGYALYVSYFLSNYSHRRNSLVEVEMSELKAPEQEKLMDNLVDHALNSA